MAITLSLTMGLIYFASSVSQPNYQIRLVDLVSMIQIHDKSGHILDQGTVEEIKSKPLDPRAWMMKVSIDWNLRGEEAALYLEPMQTATSVNFGSGVVETFGNFSYDTPPRIQSAMVAFPPEKTDSKFTISYLLTSMTGDHFILLDMSGVGDVRAISVSKFFKTFLTSYGFLGLACVFITASLVLIMIGINFHGEHGLVTLGLASTAMAWISVYFSRIVNDLPFIGYINQISFCIYFLIQGFLSLTVASWFQNRVPQISVRAVAIISFLFSLSQGILAIYAPMSTQLDVYKIQLIIGIFGWFYVALLCSLSQYRFGQEWLQRTIIALSFWIVAFGQLNDTLRVFYRDIFVNNLGPYFWFIAILLLVGLVCHTIYQRYKEALVNEKTLAIAQTTQMLAHDVKKPFSLIENLLIIFRSSNDPEKIKKVAEHHIQDVQLAIQSVNGMIADVMEIGSNAVPRFETTPLDKLILESLRECCAIFSKKRCHVSWALDQNSFVEVSPDKVKRVFSNIISNAFQAMDADGRLWFSSRVINQKMLEISISNSGSWIAKDQIPNLFNAFYTKNKTNGTGLGLAIAHKIIKAHGGQISCESSRNPDIVTFKLTIPLAKVSGVLKEQLPLHTDLVHNWFLGDLETSVNDNSGLIDDPREHAFEQAIEKWVQVQGRRLRIGFLDDEELYRKGFQELACSSERLKDCIQLVMFDHPDKALSYFEVEKVDAFICDIDLGVDEMNGFQLVSALRSRGFMQSICVHSNRGLPSDYEEAIRSGAQAFLPKPMSRPHLQKFLVGAVVGDSALLTSTNKPTP